MHLKILRTQGMLEASWTDQSLDPGDDWDHRIKGELDRADVILMLVSAEALATDYIRKIEMPRALARHAAGEALAVAIILKECSYQKTPLGKWQAILPNRQPVLDNSPQRKGWAAVEKKLHEVFRQLRRKHP
jgi:internalin A